MAPLHAQTLPTSGTVVSGSAAISAPSGTSVLITQTSRNAIINWGSFSVGAGNAVRFENGSGATLNRVVGLTPSQIDGSLSATGSVYLVNPNGITVGPSGQVTTGGSFIASTHDVSDAEFNAGGAMTFRGSSTASVINYGSIGSLGGDVALIARKVENAGTITAPNGTVGLAAGYEVLMRDAALSDGKFVVKVGGADTEAKTSGLIKAAEAELKANGGNVYALAGNTDSITKATGVATKGGRIFLTAGDGGTVTVTQKVSARAAASNGKGKGGEIRVSGGTVKVSGQLDAKGEGDAGGTIVVTGRDIQLAAGAELDASGTTGGLVLVGGDYQGGADAATKYLAEDVATATTTTVEAGATIRADGTAGAGGRIVVWSNEKTSFAGAISATGAGAASGGDAEVSGKAVLAYDGTADLRSESGTFGTLLLDPYNLTISSASSSGMSGFSASADDSVLNVTTLQNALATANVTVTTGSSGSQAGNITVAAPVTWSTTSTLTLSAYGNIAVNANLAGGTGSSIVLRADNTGTGTGSVTFGTGVTATASGGVSIYYNPAGNVNTSVNGTSYTTPSSYSANAGSGTTITAYMLVNTVYDLQNVQNNLSGTYALGKDIDASATATWNSGAGFVPVGSSTSNFTGIFDGDGHTVSGLTINRTGTNYVGLFGMTGSTSIVRNIGVIDASISAQYWVGSLAGYIKGTVTNSYATGTVSGSDYSGGLLGYALNAAISGSYSTVAVSGQRFVGGLIGYSNSSSITASYATGTVTGSGEQVGGLIGTTALGTLTQVYATGNVNAYGWVGGLIGYANTTTITSSYATGNVSASDGYAGGLIGWSTQSTITRSYATGNATGQTTVGGLIGRLNGRSIDQSYATGSATATQDYAGGLIGYAENSISLNYVYATGSATGRSYVGGLVGQIAAASSTVSNAYSSGAVTASGNYVGGLIGFNNGTVTSSFWDQETSGVSTGIGSGNTGGVSGLLTTNARYYANYTGWDFDNIWYQVGDMRPILRSEAATANSSGIISVSNLHQLALIETNLSGSYVLSGNIDASQTSGTNAAGVWGTSGWKPIGNATTNFTGTFNGQNYTISGLTSSQSGEDGVGLFGYNSGTITNIGLISASLTGLTNVGALAGYNSGNISNAYATGTVTGDAAGSENIGGLVGNNNGTIRKSYASVTVSGAASVGGLVGDNQVAIDQSYATGSVTGTDTSETRVGGLIGKNDGTLTNSYATGNVAGVVDVGGLVGINYGTIKNAYAIGSVTGTTAASTAALVGLNSGTLSNAFWNTTTSGQTVSVNDNLGTIIQVVGLTTSQFQDTSSFMALPAASTWDFTSIWAPPSAGYYPQLYALTPVVWVSQVTTSSVYGDSSATVTPTASTGGSSSYVFGKTGDSLSLTSSISVDPTANAGTVTGTLTTQNQTKTSASGVSYRVFYYGSSVVTVTPATLTVTAGNGSMVYGDSAATISYSASGWKNNQTSSLLTGVSVTTNATSSSNVGTTYTTTASGGTLSGAAAGNYTLSYVGGSFSVTPATLTITAADGSMVYGDTVPTISYTATGWKNGQTSSLLTGVTATTNATSSSNVGTTYTTTASGGTLSGAAVGNYTLSYANGAFSVTARPLTITANANSMVYGDAVPTLTYAVGGSGLVNGDTLSGTLATAATSASNVGSYAITQGTLGASSNYSLTYTGANLAVTARPLTIAADAKSMVYGDTVPLLTYTVGGSGLVNGDTLSGALATAATSASNVGSYAITQGTLANSNYSITYTGANLAVTVRPITIAADAQSMVYGDTVPALTYTVGGSGLVNGDTLSGTLATSATSASNVGSYAITQGTLGASSNYSLTYTGANLAVTARPITIAADARSMVYGDTVPLLTYTVGGSGLVNGDTLSGTLATSATSASNVGSYAITQGTIGASSNYSLTYTGANLAVTARPITIAADARSMVYGDTVPLLTYTVGGSGLVNGDALSGTLATAATSASNVGSYAITQGTLGASSNYNLTYTGANLAVTARPLTIAADAKSMVYGDTVPALTYTVGGSGLVNGDTLSGTLATSATSASNVGSYAITQGTLGASSNYSLTYTGANLAVTARPITIAADAQSMVYGDTVPTLTYTVGGSGLVNGDALSGALATVASSSSNVGSYAITQGTLANSNYSITYTGANIAVTARPITIAADARSMVYGDTVPTLTYVVGGSGLANGDTLSGTLATSATSASNVGSYAITQGTLGASSNYSLTYTGANLAVTARPITIAADARLMVYGDTVPTLTYTVGGSGLVNGDTLSGTLATSVTSASNVGSYAITQGTLANANYAITYTGANLAVTARPITIAADARSMVYGDTVPTLTYTVGGRGLVNGDTLSGALATVASYTSNVGSYAITQGTLGASSNYSLTYTGANLAVTARPLTVTANNQTRVAGTANPALTYVVSGAGLVNGDLLSGALATDATASSPAGSYAILQGTLAASANYRLTYVGGLLLVTAAANGGGGSTPGGGQTGGSAASTAAQFQPSVFVPQTPPDQRSVTDDTIGTIVSLQTPVETNSSPSVSDTGTSGGCSSGSFSAACQDEPHPDNRNLGRWLTFRAQ